MQPILERLTQQLRAKGLGAAEADRTAVETLTRSGVLRAGTRELTAKGREREAMGAAGRAKDRAAARSGRSVSDYEYDPGTNRATLKTSVKKMMGAARKLAALRRAGK